MVIANVLVDGAMLNGWLPSTLCMSIVIAKLVSMFDMMYGRTAAFFVTVFCDSIVSTSVLVIWICWKASWKKRRSFS